MLGLGIFRDLKYCVRYLCEMSAEYVSIGPLSFSDKISQLH